MRLIDVHTLDFETFLDERILPPYAILSHTWGGDEVQYQHLLDHEKFRQDGKLEFAKVDFICEQAKRDSLKYAWVDTCCIDKTSSAELTEAINSMYRWYQGSTRCYVYMVDVVQSDRYNGAGVSFQDSRWFTRGWTLQELLASDLLAFYDGKGSFLGTQHDLLQEIQLVTGIPNDVLTHAKPLSACSIAMKMSWASKRKTTRLEDEAYCLLGIFDVNMPLLYGEGDKAFLRLQEEIIKRSTDQSILVYKGDRSNILAPSPMCFADSSTICPADWSAKDKTYEMTNRGLRIQLRLWRSWQKEFHVDFALLDCVDTDAPEYYIGLPIPTSNKLARIDDITEIVLGLGSGRGVSSPNPSWERIPFNEIPKLGDRSMGVIPALAERLAVLLLRGTLSTTGEAGGLRAQVHLHESTAKLAVRLYPDAKWDKMASRAELADEPKIVVLSHESGTSFLLLVWTNGFRSRSHGGASANELFHYRLVVCEKPPNDHDLGEWIWQSRGTAFDTYVHAPQEAETRQLRISRKEMLAITIEPSSADSRTSIVSFDVRPAKVWWFHGAGRRRIKQGCYWIGAPLWYPLFFIEDARTNYKVRRKWHRPILEDRTERLRDWTNR